MDITLDFETCSLVPSAAVMSVGAVVWKRYGENSPFFNENGVVKYPTFSSHVDLRGMFLDGFTFDNQTAEWWRHQSEDAKASVLEGDDDATPCSPIQTVIYNLFGWIEYLKKVLQDKDVYLWAQGSDFDIAILRNICDKYKIPVPVRYSNFRDHRTFYMEGARIICDAANVEFYENAAYRLVDEYEGQGSAHDPIYDCKRSIYSTWQMMKHLQCLKRQV